MDDILKNYSGSRRQKNDSDKKGPSQPYIKPGTTQSLQTEPAAEPTAEPTAEQGVLADLTYAFAVIRRDRETKSPLAGGVFELALNGESPGDVEVTDWDGQASFTLDAGNTYTLTEIQPPDGYKKALGVYTIEAPASGAVLINGKPGRRLIISTVQDPDWVPETEEAAPGPPPEAPAYEPAPAPVYEPAPEPYQEPYQEPVAEAAPSYEEPQQSYSYEQPAQVYAEAAAPAPAPQTEALDPNRANIEVRYVGIGNRIPVAGQNFVLSSEEYDLAIEQTNAEGIAKFYSVEPGDYKIRTYGNVPGYQQEHNVILTPTIEGGKNYGYVMNALALQQVAFRINDNETGRNLADCVWELSPASSIQSSGSYVCQSDTNGVIDFGSVPPGEYTMAETAAPANYKQDRSIRNVSVQSDGEVFIDGQHVTLFYERQDKIEEASGESE